MLLRGNADGLSRQSCEDCKQCELIEKRDGGPTRQELGLSVDETLLSALKVAEESGSPKEYPSSKFHKIVTRATGSDAELAKEQASGTGPVHYDQALQNEIEVTAEKLDSGCAEPREHKENNDCMPDGHGKYWP